MPWPEFDFFEARPRVGRRAMRIWRRGGGGGTGRRAAETLGRGAETWAALWLRLKGYRILGRRVRTPLGEIDLIARRGRLICFVEVKARATRAAALSALTPAQCRRIERAARWWCARNNVGGRDLRFDLVAVTPGLWPHHLSDAWRSPD